MKLPCDGHRAESKGERGKEKGKKGEKGKGEKGKQEKGKKGKREKVRLGSDSRTKILKGGAGQGCETQPFSIIKSRVSEPQK